MQKNNDYLGYYYRNVTTLIIIFGIKINLSNLTINLGNIIINLNNKRKKYKELLVSILTHHMFTGRIDPAFVTQITNPLFVSDATYPVCRVAVEPLVTSADVIIFLTFLYFLLRTKSLRGTSL